LQCVAAVSRIDDANAEPVAGRPDIAEHPGRTGVVEDHEIDAAIVVEIAGGHTASDVQRRQCRTGALGHVGESTATIVAGKT
jgi:hypothetical protein